MADSDTAKKLLEALHNTNETLLKISENTILAGPEMKYIPSPIKALWLGEEHMLNTFRQSFASLQVDVKQNATDAYSKARVTVAQKLTEQKALIEEELDKVLKEQELIKSTLLSSVDGLNNVACGDNSVEEEIIYM